MITDEQKKQLEICVAALDRQYGKGTVIKLDANDIEPWPSIPTGALTLDMSLGIGGLPKGRMVEIYGEAGCIAADTFIPFAVRDKDGRIQNSKGGSIADLYRRFNKIPTAGSGYYQRQQTLNSDFYILSINDENRFAYNRVINVVDAGLKECFEVKAANGTTISVSAEHPFYIGHNKYVAAKDLQPGQEVVVFGGRYSRSPMSAKQKRIRNLQEKFVYVKYHPIAGTKIVRSNGNEYVYHRLKQSRAVLEAKMNNLSYEGYIESLNNGDITMLFLPREFHVHHKDHNYLNNDIANLEVILGSEHNSKHSSGQPYIYATTTHIMEVNPVRELPTYDIEMQVPYNNYLANNFVVHNTGKTTLALSVVAAAQRQGLVAAYIDVEHALDPFYMHAVGVNVDDLYLSQPDSGEQALDIVQKMSNTGAVSVIVIDSVAALVPQAELDGNIGDSHMGLQARLMSQALRMLNGSIAKSGTLVIFINQFRDKIVLFGDPRTTSGGRALKFFASMRLEVSRASDIKGKTGEVLGVRSRVKVAKNKLAPALKIAEFDILFGKGIDAVGCIADVAEARGIIKKSGAWYSDPETGQNLSQGRDNLIVYLKEDTELLESYIKKIAAS